MKSVIVCRVSRLGHCDKCDTAVETSPGPGQPGPQCPDWTRPEAGGAPTFVLWLLRHHYQHNLTSKGNIFSQLLRNLLFHCYSGYGKLWCNSSRNDIPKD